MTNHRPLILTLLTFVIVLVSSFLGTIARSQLQTPISAHSPFKSYSIVQATQPQNPANIHIPGLNLTTAIEQVGKDKVGRMDIPQDEAQVGWWQYGAKPGEVGSAVMAGHIDRRTGGPGIFYNLDSLSLGDYIDITDDNGLIYRFIVTNTVTYPDDQFPLEKVFARDDIPRLNLITCAGFFDDQTQNYQERTVVYSRLSQTLHPDSVN